MRVGTRSVLYGAHCFFLHPWFVAAGWWKLYGFPWDPRLWIAFFVHDLGYIGKPNMDGPEGETHPMWGARLMTRLFDRLRNEGRPIDGVPQDLSNWFVTSDGEWIGPWGKFCLFHSRYYAKSVGSQPSKLCFADKLAIAYTPAWMYLPMVTATGEIREYLKNAQTADSTHWTPTGFDKRRWYAQLRRYMLDWVEAHKDGASDQWTSADRHARTSSGVWQ